MYIVVPWCNGFRKWPTIHSWQKVKGGSWWTMAAERVCNGSCWCLNEGRNCKWATVQLNSTKNYVSLKSLLSFARSQRRKQKFKFTPTNTSKESCKKCKNYIWVTANCALSPMFALVNLGLKNRRIQKLNPNTSGMSVIILCPSWSQWKVAFCYHLQHATLLHPPPGQPSDRLMLG